MTQTRILAPQLPAAAQGLVTGDPAPDDLDASGLQGGGDVAAAEPQASTLNLGPWLTDKEEDVAKDIAKEWTSQERRMKALLTRWDLNERRRAGDVYSKLVSDVDTDSVRLYTPIGVQYAPPSILKTDELCEKMVAQLTADMPAPECEPSKDSDPDRDAAEFCRRFLEDQGAESSLNMAELCDEAEDIACNCGSGFTWIYPDPRGGGPKPKTMTASPAATSVQDALFAQQPHPDDPTQMQSVPQPGPYIDRYVTPDGMLTDDQGMADIEWGPKLCGDVLSGRNVRYLPATARSISDADGAMIAAYTTLGDLKARFSEKMGALTGDQLRAIVSWKPPQAKGLLPTWAQQIDTNSSTNTGTDGPPDKSPVLVMTVMRTAKGAYPKGCYVVMAGGNLLLDRRPWTRTVYDPETKKEEERPNSIWLAQFRQFFSSRDRNPYGDGLVDKLIDGDPLLAIAIGSLIDRVEKANNPHLFVPLGSGISDKMLSLPRGTPLPYNPNSGGKPVYEDLGDFAPEVMELYSLVGERMDQRALLGPAVARGLDDPTAVSGKAKSIALSAAGIQLSRVKRGFDTGWTRTQRIVLEAGQMTFTKPAMIRVVGEDGSYKFDQFSSVNLGTTVDVRIKPGTGTLLNPDQKEAVTMGRLSAGIITPEEAKDQLRSHLRSQTGLEDDPALLRVKRQLTSWEQGPPEGWQPPPPAQPQVMGVDPTGQPQIGTPPLPPDPANPFAQALPIDDEPDLARVRHYQIRRVLNRVVFTKKPPQWQQYLLDEYQHMRQAAGVMTLQEQAQAQQQQAMQQAELNAIGKVSAVGKVDASTVGPFVEAEKAALSGTSSGPSGPTPAPQPEAAPHPEGNPSSPRPQGTRNIPLARK